MINAKTNMVNNPPKCIANRFQANHHINPFPDPGTVPRTAPTITGKNNHFARIIGARVFQNRTTVKYINKQTLNPPVYDLHRHRSAHTQGIAFAPKPTKVDRTRRQPASGSALIVAAPQLIDITFRALLGSRHHPAPLLVQYRAPHRSVALQAFPVDCFITQRPLNRPDANFPLNFESQICAAHRFQTFGSEIYALLHGAHPERLVDVARRGRRPLGRRDINYN